MLKGNAIVGQSGGPTAVINASLAGVFKTAKENGIKKYMVWNMDLQDLLNVIMLNLMIL